MILTALLSTLTLLCFRRSFMPVRWLVDKLQLRSLSLSRVIQSCTNTEKPWMYWFSPQTQPSNRCKYISKVVAKCCAPVQNTLLYCSICTGNYSLVSAPQLISLKVPFSHTFFYFAIMIDCVKNCISYFAVEFSYPYELVHCPIHIHTQTHRPNNNLVTGKSKIYSLKE